MKCSSQRQPYPCLRLVPACFSRQRHGGWVFGRGRIRAPTLVQILSRNLKHYEIVHQGKSYIQRQSPRPWKGTDGETPERPRFLWLQEILAGGDLRCDAMRCAAVARLLCILVRIIVTSTGSS